jgi:hypothetical membrane protein
MENVSTRNYYAGAIVWIAGIQYFIVQLIVAAQWSTANPYNWAMNAISDLANTVCSQYYDRYVCSPQHMLMNVSFILFGITMAGGAYLLRHHLNNRRAVALMMISGIATTLVGFYPENVNVHAHVATAVVSFISGGMGLVWLSLTIKPRMLRQYTLVSGVLSLTAFVLLAAHNYIGLGSGTIERFISYPQSAWMIVYGVYLLITAEATGAAKT